MKKTNNYTLTDNQIKAIRIVHSQLILDGLADLGLDLAVEREIISNGNKNFDLMITNVQMVLAEDGINEEIRKEIQEEDERIKISEEKKMARKAIKKNKKNGK